MGCKGSKLDNQEAVALCRGRADLLAVAARHRYALADAHGDLADSLASVAAALHLLMTSHSAQPHPTLALPASRKGAAADAPRQPGSSPHHPSSHIDFAPTSSDDSESGSASSSPNRHRRADHHLPHPTALPFPLPLPHYGYGGYGYVGEPPLGGSLRLYYARTRPPPPSVVAVEQPPERVYFGYSDRGYSYGGDPVKPATRAATPPSPPRESSWDFFNVFGDYDVYDNYCYDTRGAGAAAYTPSRSSWEVRQEEGIPDLEEEDAVVVKQVDSEYSAPGAGCGIAKVKVDPTKENSVADKEVNGRGNVTHQQPTAASVARGEPAEGSDVAAQIKRQFVRASDAVRAVAPILEVQRRRHHHRSSVYHVVSSRMVSAIPVPHPDHGPVELLDVGEDKVMGGRSLSLTLQKLYIWEKKLYHEVKAEEKMRLLLAKNSKRLKFLDLKGAETEKIEKTRNLIRKLLTKIRISVRVITKVSKKINRIRDDELQPQINALVQGFVRMWQDKLDCYQIQCQVMTGVKDLDFVSGGSSRESAIELEVELIKWIAIFSCWLNLQRSFIKALNGWLALCFSYKAEETADGVPPSPGRAGAPLVFVICNRWSQAMDHISEKEVIISLQALVSTVRKLSEQPIVEQSEHIIATRAREKWNKVLERKTLAINKENDALNSKLALVPGRQSLLPSAHTYQEHHLEASSLQAGLERVVQALESFASTSKKAFEEILKHTEGERAPRENAKAS